MQADKRTLISKFELGIPIRDMRLLDSTLVTSSRGYIAVRENAIVFAIECGLSRNSSFALTTDSLFNVSTELPLSDTVAIP